VGPRAGLDAVAKRKKSLPLAGNRTALVRPRSLVTILTELYRLCHGVGAVSVGNKSAFARYCPQKDQSLNVF
jgi:hypothetical protein